MTIQIPSINTSEFNAAAAADGETIRVRFAGNADLRVMEAMSGMLTQLHAEATRAAIKEVVVDFRDLEFMNSSCFKNFVTWLGRLQEMEPAAQYHIRFLSNTGRHWQRRSLTALSCFAVDLVRIET